ncbi:MAG: hypothetical protein V3T77_02485, partial [Planctomycetota bacterium]
MPKSGQLLAGAILPALILLGAWVSLPSQRRVDSASEAAPHILWDVPPMSLPTLTPQAAHLLAGGPIRGIVLGLFSQ